MVVYSSCLTVVLYVPVVFLALTVHVYVLVLLDLDFPVLCKLNYLVQPCACMKQLCVFVLCWFVFGDFN